jgi:hypothetical protein
VAGAIVVRGDYQGLLAIAGSRALLFVDLSPLALACNSSMPDPANRRTLLVAATTSVL